jgi:hypothetical protein
MLKAARAIDIAAAAARAKRGYAIELFEDRPSRRRRSASKTIAHRRAATGDCDRLAAALRERWVVPVACGKRRRVARNTPTRPAASSSEVGNAWMWAT